MVITGFFRGLFTPVLRWFEDYEIRQKAFIDAQSDVQRHTQEALLVAAQSSKRVDDVIDQHTQLELDDLYKRILATRGLRTDSTSGDKGK